MNLIRHSSLGISGAQHPYLRSVRHHPIPVQPFKEWPGLFKPLHGRQVKLPDGLPRVRPKTFFYVSAGRDFRPLVFLSDAYRQHRLAEHSIPRPDLFVYSCLGSDGLHGLKTGMTVFKDKRTEIAILSLQPLRIDRKKTAYRIDSALIHGVEDPLLDHDYDAALMEVEVKSLTLGTSDRFPLLYLAMENINCFDELMSKGWFDVQFLCTTREGLGFGNCGKSLIQHLYTEGRNRTKNFHPRFLITWGDYTDTLFRNSAKRFYPELRRLADYIPENPGAHDHHFYECWNQHKPGVLNPQMGSPFHPALNLPLGR